MKIIGQFPNATTSITRHAWDLILDGHIRELEPGSDFPVHPDAFIRATRAAARRRGLTVDVRKHRRRDGRVVVIVKAKR
jgi:hypothetical protein